MVELPGGRVPVIGFEVAVFFEGEAPETGQVLVRAGEDNDVHAVSRVLVEPEEPLFVEDSVDWVSSWIDFCIRLHRLFLPVGDGVGLAGVGVEEERDEVGPKAEGEAPFGVG